MTQIGLIKRLILSPQHRERMRGQVSQAVPEEACGIIGGVIEGDTCRALEVIAISNALHSPVRYRMDPEEQWAAFQTLEKQGLELVGIYHSHPNGPEAPSPTDIAEAYYPEAVYLIWSRQGDEWDCRAFTIQDGLVEAIAIQ